MHTTARRIGTIGTASRTIVGIGLIVLAFAHGHSWALAWHDALLGLAAFPAFALALGLAAKRFAGRPVRFTGPLGLALNTVVIATFAAIAYTAAATALFYGVMLLVAAWRGQPGCEVTVLPNVILRRDDQIGCPAFTPIDAIETRLTRGDRAASTTGTEPA